MVRAYYNEIDPNAAQWLRNLITAGHIAPGDVDERSIEDVLPADLMGYSQCHFFAGIGIWSYSLRQAGWPDDRPVWTGSCPCQPFSTAGKGAGVADERHLWPAWFHLLQHGKPPDVPVFGEQVANGDGLTWLDLVQADMEGAGYAFRAVDLCAAGVGAPHIRQRLFFHAARAGVTQGDASQQGLEGQRRDGDNGDEPGRIGADEAGPIAQAGAAGGLADPGHGERSGRDAIRDAEGEHGREARSGEGAGAERERPVDDAAVRGPGCWLAYAQKAEQHRDVGGTGPQEGGRPSDRCATERVANPEDGGRGEQRSAMEQGNIRHADGGGNPSGRPGPVNGRWGAADWLWCRDNKWRPVEPGTFPLVDGATGRMGYVCAHCVEANAQDKDDEMLRAVWEVTCPIGGCLETEVLQQGVHGKSVHEAARHQGGGAVPSPEDVRGEGVSRLREGGALFTSTPQGREPNEQRPGEHCYSVFGLPCEGAREASCCESCGREAEWMTEARIGANRTVRLRAYGNGIVSEVASAFIKAVM